MIFFYVIIAVIKAMPTAALAKGPLGCNLSEPSGAQQCFGALGESLMFYLPTNTTTHLKKNNDSILRVAKNTVKSMSKAYSNRAAFLRNGTFKLHKATKEESGDYQLQTYNPDGKLLSTIKFHLKILAPVSPPAVSQLCLSPEQMKVSCFSEGDEAELILTLDNITLLGTGCTVKHHTPNVSNVTISLHGQLTGNLMCHAWNTVSGEERVIHLTSCKVSVSHLSLVTVAVISTIAILLLFLALFRGIKHLNRKIRPTTVSEDNTEDEVVYSDVRVKPTRKTRPNTHENAT